MLWYVCTGVLCGVRERGTVVRVYWILVWGEGMRYCGTCVLGSCLG